MRLGRALIVTALVALALAAAIPLAFRLSPWPGVLLIRASFDRGAADASAKLVRHLPAGLIEHLDVVYDPASRNGRLDLFSRMPEQPRPTVVWVHGGGWISGTKTQIDNYARVLAARGFTVASVDYTIAPEATYPTPVRQVATALRFLEQRGGALGVDAMRLFLAGDSGGAHIAAQVAAAVANPSYAARVGVAPAIARSALRGMVLFCGAYDVRAVNLDGSFGGFLRTVLWAYSGTRDFRTDPHFASASVIEAVDQRFPPAFVSAGNADPLGPQSVAFARRLAERHVPVDTLFFPADHRPALGHEYQFDLDGADGREALEREVRFLNEVAR